MHHRILLSLTLLAMLLLLSACGGLLTKAQYQEKIQNDLSQIENWELSSSQSDVIYLNDLFNASAINTLLKSAFSDNPSFQQTLITLDIRRAQLKQSSANRRLQINAGIASANEENADSTYNSSVSVSWQADLWGKLQDSSNAAEIDIKQQALLVRAARNTLGSEILSAWIALINQNKNIAIQQRRISTLEQNEMFILQRYRNGLGSLSDLDSAHLTTSSAHAQLIADQQQSEQSLRDLQLLIGQLSAMTVTIPNDYPDVAVAAANLPIETLGQRPDLQAAYLAIQSSELRAAVAYKALLPSFNLDLTLNSVATTVRDSLFVSPVWSLLGQLTAPLYQGGQLQAEAEMADLETAMAYQVYKEQLLTAVIEVENFIGQEQSLRKQLRHLEAALKSANSNLTNYQTSYRTGLVTILDLLTVQQQTYDLEDQINDTIFTLLSNRISLGLALGLEIKQ